jgi:hypothetical protein
VTDELVRHAASLGMLGLASVAVNNGIDACAARVFGDGVILTCYNPVFAFLFRGSLCTFYGRIPR